MATEMNSKPIPFAEVIEITVSIAKKMLAGHENYRGLDIRRVIQYADDMQRGDWDECGQPILFDENNNLIDGQHRLHAVVRSGCSIRFWVIYGERGVETMDTHKPRSLRNLLERRQYPKAQLVAAALQYVWAWETTGKLLRDTGSSYPSRKTLLACLERHPRLHEYCAQNKALASLGLTNAFTSALRYVLICSSSEDVAFQFLGELAVGEMLQKTSPVFQLRTRLIRNKERGAIKVSPRTVFALVTKAWNLWVSGQDSPRTFKWTSIGPAAEDFPRVLRQSEVDDAT
jgi:hypothetical protein